ncbi:MAG: DUF1217 domain-containing protein [bacterium]
MSFTPVIPLAGYAGWTFLQRTMAKQTASLVKSPEIARDEDYFRANIAKITTAEDLVKDRRLLKVALGAFGLDADINNKAFIEKVLKDGTLTAGALANKLADKQYLKLSAAFGFGDYPVPSTKLSDFPGKIISAYEARAFETAVGDQNDDMRLALNAKRELAALSVKSSSETVKWFTVLGNSALKQVFTKALGLPSNISAVDLDQQLKAFQDKTQTAFGDNTVAQFSDPAKVETLIRRFLVRSQADQLSRSTGPGAAALAMLQQTASTMWSRR